MIGLQRRVLGNQLPLLSVGGGSMVVIWMLVSIVTSLSSSSRQRAEIRAATAEVLAEELAVRVVAEGETYFDRFGYRAAGRVYSGESGEELHLVVWDPVGESHRYRAELLSGAAPDELANCLSIAWREAADPRMDPDWAWLERPGVPNPRWLSDGLPAIAEPNGDAALRSTSVVADPSIGLLRLQAGTDREDFVLATDEDGRWRPTVPESGVLRVPGNLWLCDPDGLIEVEVEGALTLLVEGNLYVDASLRVRETGQLFLVAREQPGSCYQDLDLDGRFSSADRAPGEGPYRGYLEGSGVVHLGPPDQGPRRPLRIEASMYAEGELVLRVPSCELGGATLLGRGLTMVEPGAGLRFTAEHLPKVLRCGVPGFAVSGARRPGELRAARRGAFSGFGPSIPDSDG